MKPIILIVGSPHSMTSMTVRFLIKNGCGSGLEETKVSNFKGNNTRHEYINAEDWPVRDAINRMRAWKHDKISQTDLKTYFSLLPEDEIIAIKVPWAGLFLDRLAALTDRPMKVVYCIRDPHDVMASTFDKEKTTFTFFRLFHLYCSLYKMTVQTELPLYMLPVERLANKDLDTAEQLLKFCEADLKHVRIEWRKTSKTISKILSVDWSTIEPRHIKKRKYTYINYRLSNFVYKQIDRAVRILS